MSNKEKMPKTVNERVQKYRVSLSEEKKAIVRAKDNIAYPQCVFSTRQNTLVKNRLLIFVVLMQILFQFWNLQNNIIQNHTINDLNMLYFILKGESINQM